MTRGQALVRQARSDFRDYQQLSELDRALVPECHPLHYFQMASEKVAKAAFGAMGIVADPFSHVAFSRVPQHMSRRDVARSSGDRNFHAYRDFLSRSAPLFRRIDELNPAVGLQVAGGGAKDGPNVEYPWEARNAAGVIDWFVPAEQNFRLLQQMKLGGEAAGMVDFVRRLLNRFDVVFS